MIILYILIFIILIILLISAITYKITFKKSKKDNNIHRIPSGQDYQERKNEFLKMIDKFNEIPYEDVFIKSYDNLKLHARYYHVSDNAPISICFHGYRSTAIRDFCGGAEMCLTHGHNILLIDQRAHGQSKGNTISFGIKERFDCIEWINYISKKFPNSKILLYGISMGAATILMASELIENKNVVGIIADSPYSTPSKIIKKVCNDDMHIPSKLAFPFIYIGALIYGRFKLNASSPLDSVKNSKIPILLIHGTKDTYVPHTMSEDLASTNQDNINLVLFPNAEHALSYIIDTKKYKTHVSDFLKKVL